MKRKKCLKELLKERADLDLLSVGDALEVIEDWLAHIPQRAMYMQPDGNSIMLISKREAFDALYSSNNTNGEKGYE